MILVINFNILKIMAREFYKGRIMKCDTAETPSSSLR